MGFVDGLQGGAVWGLPPQRTPTDMATATPKHEPKETLIYCPLSRGERVGRGQLILKTSVDRFIAFEKSHES